MALAKGRIRGKVINIERPGRDIKINFNGQRYNYADSSVVDMPWAVSEVLRNAVKLSWKQVGNSMVQEKKARYMFVEMPETEAEKAMSAGEKKNDELIKDIIEDKPKKVVKKK